MQENSKNPSTKGNATMDPEELELLAGAAKTLSESVAALEHFASELEEKIGSERLEVVRAVLERSYERGEEYEVRASLSYTERKLLWVWVRLRNLKDLRCTIGRDSMRNIS
ncbi:MAG: hypothetical protein CVU17_09980 [Betaproteobacteria bacterium HGW-Betaproteobacteria-11]|nr:MAG: hypothetical protein CVU17_09980 [Betaproteobacteria bacterium HGW-Betaproteobacteria-11]